MFRLYLYVGIQHKCDAVSKIDCKLKYISETSINIYKRLFEHKRDLRLGHLKNAFFLHISKIDYHLYFNAAMMLAHIHNRILRQIFDASANLHLLSVNTQSGFFNLSPNLGTRCIQ